MPEASYTFSLGGPSRSRAGAGKLNPPGIAENPRKGAYLGAFPGVLPGLAARWGGRGRSRKAMGPGKLPSTWCSLGLFLRKNPHLCSFKQT